MYNPTTTTGKKRIRATQACVLCRKKKIKCDGTKPQCFHCQDSNMTCEYTESKKRGPRKGYVQLLEDRLMLLEQRLGETKSDNSNNLPFMNESLDMTLQSKKNEWRGGDLFTDDLPPMDILLGLVDLFFKHINSVFPMVHRTTMREEIMNGTVSKPLLWSAMAIAARFSDDPRIKTDIPYSAAEKFTAKALESVDIRTMEPTLANLQFWGIMSCIEYGRGSGSKAWLYGGMSVRMCEELGLTKEETQKTPILKKDGTVDEVAMALRRRIFWSCLCMDRFASAGTNRPQHLADDDYDVRLPVTAERLILLDPPLHVSRHNVMIKDEPLIDIVPFYLRSMVMYGRVNKALAHAKSADATGVQWPPVDDFEKIDGMLRRWKETLPNEYRYSPETARKYGDEASENYLSLWHTMHAVWCTSMLVLHRGSLAYQDVRSDIVSDKVYDSIQYSIETCKSCVALSMEVFQSMRDLVGVNVLPYMGYSCYILATVLLTSTFARDEQSYKQSCDAYATLYNMIRQLTPYWPVSERLLAAMKDLYATYHRLHGSHYKTPSPHPLHKDLISSSQGVATSTMPSPTYALQHNTPSMTTASMPTPLSSSMIYSPSTYATDRNGTEISTPSSLVIPSQAYLSVLPDAFSGMAGEGMNTDFLYDSGLFGQIMFDYSRQVPNMNGFETVPGQLSSGAAGEAGTMPTNGGLTSVAGSASDSMSTAPCGYSSMTYSPSTMYRPKAL